MAGLSKICKSLGGITVRNQNGEAVHWVWDYVAQKAVHETDMPVGSERWKASEAARAAGYAKWVNDTRFRPEET